MKTDDVRRSIAYFLVLLVISMPFYSASALAAVTITITENSGEAGIQKFLDAEGDTWNVKATIEGTMEESIDPTKVNVVIGQKKAPFTSCASGQTGVDCEYISPLTDGVTEAEYGFQVVYDYLSEDGLPKQASDADVIRADGSAPLINGYSISQENDGVHLDFTARDKYEGKPAVGLKAVEILNADTGEILLAIPIDAEGMEEFDYVDDGNFDGLLKVPFEGEGKKRIKIRATDRLGHVTQNPPVLTFESDFVKPEIVESSLNFTNVGKFLGDFVVTTDVAIDVIDEHLENVFLSSDKLGLSEKSADSCEELDDDIKVVNRCVWDKVEVAPTEALSVTVKAIDAKGNVAEKMITRSFVKDTDAPLVEFFGSERVFEGIHYLSAKGDKRIVLRVKEIGAGMSQQGVRANLAAIGGDNAQVPNECHDEASLFVCTWDVSGSISAGKVIIGLSTLRDTVGNEGKLSELQVQVDDAGPKVEKVELFGVSAAGGKTYYQSGDKINIKLTAAEQSGLMVLVDMNDLVMDAETKFPENEFTRGLGTGWQVFTQENCKRNEQQSWECSFETSEIKSGPDSSAQIEIKVQDTAGNDFSEWQDEPKNVKTGNQGKYTLDLLGLSTEEKPDFWEVASVQAVGGTSAFIDLDTTHLTHTRLPFSVKLRSSNPQVELLSVQMGSCVAENQAEGNVTGEGAEILSPIVSRNLLYGSQASTNPFLVLEFEPFDGKKLFAGIDDVTVPYTCALRIFSRLGKNALNAAEVQEVSVDVPFGFSALGAEDENLQGLIDEEREAVSTGFWGVIGTLTEFFKWVDYLVQVVQLIMGAIQLVKAVQVGIEPLYQTPARGGAVAACFGLSGAEKGIDTGMSIIDVPLQILSCRPGPKLGWYSTWVNGILSLYNVEILKSPASPLGENQYRPARSIKDNLYLSVAGLCLPGIIQNLDKYRQIKCRKIYCLETEVPAGLATVGQCNELEGLLTCKYFLGELWYILPFSKFWDSIINGAWNAIKDPIAVAHTVTIVACGITCVASSKLSSTCSYLYYIWDVIDYIENIAGFVTTVMNDIENGGLKYCDSVL